MPRMIAPPPSGESFQIRLQKPFKGEATYSVEVIGEPNRSASVKVKQGENEKTGDLPKEDVNELMSLISQVRGFPSDPSKDVFGLDTGLDLNTFEIQWSNVDDASSAAEVGDETKKSFKDVIDSIEALGRQFAKKDAAI